MELTVVWNLNALNPSVLSGLLCFPHSHMGGSPIPACVLLSHYRCEGDLSGGLYYNRRKSILFLCNTYVHTHALIHTWLHENTPAFTHVYLYIHAHTCAKPLAYSNVCTCQYTFTNIHENICTHYTCFYQAYKHIKIGTLHYHCRKNTQYHNLRERFLMMQGQEDRSS